MDCIDRIDERDKPICCYKEKERETETEREREREGEKQNVQKRILKLSFDLSILQT